MIRHDGSLGGLSQVSESLVKYIDEVTDLVQPSQAVRVHGALRPRGLTAADVRKVERGAGVRGGLMAIVHSNDPHFGYRFASLGIVLFALYMFSNSAVPYGKDTGTILNFCEYTMF